MTTATEHRPHIYTIGHSNQSLESFVQLLKEHYIQLIIDVRTYPVSRFAPHFNRQILERALPDHAILYRFAGKQLGGRPDGDEFYDEDGHVLYSKVAASDLFRDGIDQLQRVAPKYRTAIMCSEENPADCHRRLLIGRVLRDRGVTLFHIRGTGDVEEEATIVDSGQGVLPLFGTAEDDSWRSVRSVLHRRPPASSSTH